MADYWDSSRLPSASPYGTYSLSGSDNNVATKTDNNGRDQHLEGLSGYSGNFRKYFEIKFTRNPTYRSYHDFVIGFCTKNASLSKMVGDSNVYVDSENPDGSTGKGIRIASADYSYIVYGEDESTGVVNDFPVGDTTPVTVGLLVDAGFTTGGQVKCWLVVGSTIYGSNGATATPTEVTNGSNHILSYSGSQYLEDWNAGGELLYPAATLYEIGATAELLLSQLDIELLSSLPTGFTTWTEVQTGDGDIIAPTTTGRLHGAMVGVTAASGFINPPLSEIGGDATVTIHSTADGDISSPTTNGRLFGIISNPIIADGDINQSLPSFHGSIASLDKMRVVAPGAEVSGTSMTTIQSWGRYGVSSGNISATGTAQNFANGAIQPPIISVTAVGAWESNFDSSLPQVSAAASNPITCSGAVAQPKVAVGGTAKLRTVINVDYTVKGISVESSGETTQAMHVDINQSVSEVSGQMIQRNTANADINCPAPALSGVAETVKDYSVISYNKNRYCAEV